MFFQKPQRLDEFPRSLAVKLFLAFHAAAQKGETFRQIPVFQGPGMIQCSGFSLQNRQIMHWIEGHAFLAPKAFVGGDDVFPCGKYPPGRCIP